MRSVESTKILACGRRWGKTEACAIDILINLWRNKPTRQLLVAPTLDQTRILFNRIHAMISKLIAEGLWDVQGFERPVIKHSKLEMRIGEHTIFARSAKQKHHLRGEEATHIYVDEAAYVSAEVIQEILVPMMATHDGKLVLISTPKGKNFFYEYFTQAEVEEDYFSLQSPSSDNPRVREQFLAQQKKILSPQAFQREYEADFSVTDGQIFNNDALDDCTVAEPDANIGGPIIVGLDWGRYRDASAVVVTKGSDQGASVLYVDRVTNMDWNQQLDWLDGIISRFPGARVICDRTGIGDAATSWLDEKLRGRHSVEPFLISAESKQTLVSTLQKYVESRSVQLPNHPGLRRELENFNAVRSPTGHIRYEAGTGHDDLVIALALSMIHLPHASRMIFTGGNRYLV